MQQSNLTPLTPEELAEIEEILLEQNPGDWESLTFYSFRIKKLCRAIRQRDKRIEELEAQLKERDEIGNKLHLKTVEQFSKPC